jgi:hypothetical protein
MTYKILLISICLAIGILSAWLLNILVVKPLAIPDDCYYHSREAPFLINVFYDFPSSEGGHPVPSTINATVTSGIGALSGLFFAWKKLRQE